MIPQSLPSLIDRARTRWAEIGASQPDLIPAIELQRRLVTRAIGAVERLNGAGPAILDPDPAQVANRLRAGTPAFRGEPVALPADVLGPLVLQACDDLADGGAGDVARRVRACLDDRRINMASLLTASFVRDQTAIRVKAVHEGIAPDVLWLVAELGVGPAAYVAQRTLFTQAETGLQAVAASGLETWPHGYCPACGSWPAFGEARDRSGQLRCSFCGLGWRPGEPEGCTYCGAEPGRLTSLKADPGGAHLAALCSHCGGYLKWLDVPAPTPFELLPVEDLASTPLDVLSVRQGYGRPALPEPARPERLPCPPVVPVGRDG